MSNTLWNAISEIKSKSKIIRVCAALEEMRVSIAGENGLTMAYSNAGDRFQKNGLAFYKDVCLSHANKIVDAQSVDPTRPLVKRPGALEIEVLRHRQGCILKVLQTIKEA